MSETAIGQIIADRFRIDGRLGQGGYGDVYRARQLSVDRDVAIKLVHAHLEERDDVRARFEREARLASRVRHPNVVQVIDFGEHDGRLFLAMQYIPGDTLKARLRASSPTLREAAEWIAGIASGLAAAHREGVVHRDLKPGNVILSPTPQGLQPVVIDFGLVKAFEDAEGVEDDVTHSNMLVGTPTYMSPEVVLGHPLDAKSDLYSLGVLSYVLLTGQKPVQGATAIETASLHLRGDIPNVRTLRSDCPALLADLVSELLARDPQQRPADADTVARRAQAVANSLDASSERDDRTILPTRGPAALANRQALPPQAAKKPNISVATETLTPGGSVFDRESATVPIPAPASGDAKSSVPAVAAERERGLSRVSTLVIGVAAALLVAFGAWWSMVAPTDAGGDVSRGGEAPMSTRMQEAEREAMTPSEERNAAVVLGEPVQPEIGAALGSGPPPQPSGQAQAFSQPVDVSPREVEPAPAFDANTAHRAEARESAENARIAASTSDSVEPDVIPHEQDAARRAEETAEAPEAHEEARAEQAQVAARREAPRERREESTGYLSISPRPWGDIFVDGRLVGRTLNEHPLRPGEYRIEVRYGEQSQRQNIRIREGETAQPQFRFEIEQ